MEENEVKLSVVSPCFNEADNLRECIQRTLHAVMEFDPDLQFEHIFIDNASQDGSLDQLINLRHEYRHIRILRNDDNVGVFKSIQKGIAYCRGQWVVPFLASDNQDPPELITEFLRIKQNASCDSVFGIRKTRIESKWLLSVRKLFYFFLKIALGGEYKSGTSEFCLLKRDVAIKLISIEDKNPFLRIYLSKLHGDVRYIEYEMVSRKRGKSSTSFFTLVDDALNAFSIVIPSLFSRLLVLAIPTFLLSLILFFCFLILFFILGRNAYLNWVMIFSFLSISSFTILILALIGHYVFITHQHLRTGKLSSTEEY